MKIESLTTLLNSLSWSKITQAFVLMIMVGVGYGFWDNRTIVYNSLKVGAKVEQDGPIVITIGPKSKEYIDISVEKSSNFIAGIEIVSVDFKKNTRSTSYFSIVNHELKRMHKLLEDSRVALTPLFTSNEAHNQLVIDLINGEFRCNPTDGTIVRLMFPEINKVIKTVCSVSIPPFYGRFSGFMNLYLVREPTEADTIVIRQLARDISLRIYETDIYKTSKVGND